MHYLETPATTRDWGGQTRAAGVKLLAKLPQPLDYLIFWDDDNAFYPVALRIVVSTALRIGRHAGLRCFAALRWRIGIPRVGISEPG